MHALGQFAWFDVPKLILLWIPNENQASLIACENELHKVLQDTLTYGQYSKKFPVIFKKKFINLYKIGATSIKFKGECNKWYLPYISS